jgi:coenzyme PQQ precursor peptide PqqA
VIRIGTLFPLNSGLLCFFHWSEISARLDGPSVFGKHVVNPLDDGVLHILAPGESSQEVLFMKKWNKPVIVEICVGCEINSYYSGDF